MQSYKGMKLRRFFALSMIVMAGLSVSLVSRANAETVDFQVNANLTYEGPSCYLAVNGNNGSDSIHINPGDEVSITLNNQSVSVPIRFTWFAPLSSQTNKEFLHDSINSGESFTKTYSDVHEGFVISFQLPMGEYCGSYLMGYAYVYVNEPAPEPEPAPVPSSVAQKPKTSKTSPTTSTSTTPAADSALVTATNTGFTLGLIQVGGETVDSSLPIEFETSQPLVLSGTTTPNATVLLTMHSTPQTVTVTADAQGNWSYTFKDIPAGDHYIEARTTDPVTGITTEPKTLMAFSVKPVAENLAASVPSGKNSEFSAMKFVIAGIVAATVLTFAVWRWRVKLRHYYAVARHKLGA